MSYTSLICIECEEKDSILLCTDCMDSFCENCYNKTHNKGNRMYHNIMYNPSPSDIIQLTEIYNTKHERAPAAMLPLHRERSELQVVMDTDKDTKMLLEEHHFFNLCKDGNASGVTELLRHNPMLYTATHTQFHWTSLHYAAGYGRYNIVLLLISDKKCVLNVKDYRGLTPLHECCYWVMNDYKNVMHVLIENMNLQDILHMKDKGGNICRDYLKKENDISFFDSLIHTKRIRMLTRDSNNNQNNNNQNNFKYLNNNITPYDNSIFIEQSTNNTNTTNNILPYHGSKPKLIKFDQLQNIEYLASGYFSSVYKADFNDNNNNNNNNPNSIITVVIKVPKSQNTESLMDYWKEVELNYAIPPHKNVLGIFGICLDFDHDLTKLCIITRYSEKGSLQERLIQKDLFPADMVAYMSRYVEISLEIIRGIRHLHHHGIIHRDLACRNVLMDKFGNCLVCDFGMSRTIRKVDEEVRNENNINNDTDDDDDNNNKYYTQQENANSLLPLRWSAPESVVDLKYSVQSDIYSFGMTLIELGTNGNIPLSNEPIGRKVFAIIIRGRCFEEVLHEIGHLHDDIKSIIKDCLLLDRHLRPSCDDIIERLERIRVQL